MYRCKHFQLYELVDKRMYSEKGEQAWDLFAPEALMMIDNIHDFFDELLGGVTVRINNWFWNGPFQFRGFRPEWCSEGALHSEHRLGHAFDQDILGKTRQISVEEVRQEILRNKNHDLLKLINRIEGGVNWLHTDIKPVPDRIHIFTA